MPELPEVETIRRDLSKKIIGKKIARFEILKKTVVKAGLKEIERVLADNEVKSIERRGKLLIFELSDNFLLIHLKMTGQLIYRYDHHEVMGGHNLLYEFGVLPNKYTQVVFHFADKSKLFFNDMRRFGYIKLVSKAEKEKVEAGYGIEPLSTKFTQRMFREILSKKSGIIKAALLDQSAIAGIGNIYSDEICYCAGVLPDRKVKSLKPEEINKLYRCIPEILKLAIKHRGTTFRDYRDGEGKKGSFVDFLKVYSHEGEKCACGKGIIKKKKIAGRGSSFCSECQK